jgi:hypothetical protein
MPNSNLMKTRTLFILLLVADFCLSAQQRDFNYFLEQAKINSPLINKNINENKIVNLDLQQIKSILFKPEINLVSGFLFAPIISHDNNKTRFELASEGATNYIGHDIAVTDGGQYQALVSVRQPLFSANKYKLYENKAGISGKINDNNIAMTIHELEQVVGYQYILCMKANKQAQNSLSLLNEVNRQLETMKKLVESAVYKQTDLMLLQIEIQNMQLDHKMYTAEYLTNLYDLYLVCGIKDTTGVELKETDFIPKYEKTNSSKFLTSYWLHSLNIAADQTINELKYKPQINFLTDAGLNAAYIPYLKRIGLSTGISLNWTIFDGHQRDYERGKSAINLQTLDFEKNNFLKQNDIQKNKILNQIDEINQRITLIEHQASQYDLLYQAFTKELSQGETSVMDFKNLIKDIAANKQENLQLKMEIQLLINAYNYLNY